MKGLLQRLGLILFGLALAWIALEAVVRVTDRAAPPVLGTDFDRSPALFFAQPERLHPWSGDHEDPFRIAVIGDSFTVGQGVQVDDAYPARLERLLNLNAGVRPAEVKTWAREGSSTSDQLKFLRQALAAEVDLIVLGIFINDTESNQSRAWRRQLRPRIPTGWKLELLQTSEALAWIYSTLEQARIQREWVEYIHRIYEPDTRGWKDFARAVRRFGEISRANGVPVVAIILPPPGVLGADYPFEFAHQAIRDQLESSQIPYLDLLDIFRGRSGLRLAVLPGVDGHYNEIGHRLAAEALFGFLLKEGHIPIDYNPALAESQPRRYWLKQLREAKSVVPSP